MHLFDELGGFRRFHFRLVDDEQLAFGLFGGKRRFQRQRTNLLGQFVCVFARFRAKDDTATTHLRGAGRSLAGVTAAFLVKRLFAATGNIGTSFGVMNTGTAFGKLPINCTRQEIGANLETENRIVQIDRADLLVIKADDIQFHWLIPSYRRRPHQRQQVLHQQRVVQQVLLQQRLRP